MPHFKKVIISSQKPHFILQENLVLVGNSIKDVAKHEAVWLLDDEDQDSINEELYGDIICNEEAAIITANKKNIIILSDSSNWYFAVANFKNWSFFEQQNWSRYINTLYE